MARTSINIPYRDALAAKEAIEQILSRCSFARTIVKNEFVWKGKGLQSGICVKVEFTPNNSVNLYSWVTSSIEGDQDLSGPAGYVPKQKTIQMLHEIQAAISGL